MRYNVGLDVINAMEDALIDLWMYARPSPNVPSHPGSLNIPVDCGHCSSVVLDSSNYKATQNWTLWMHSSEFQHAICTNHWEDQIQLRICQVRANQITGADPANFVKILYQCYGVIVKDLRKKGFCLSLDRPVVSEFYNQYEELEFDMSATITIGLLSA